MDGWKDSNVKAEEWFGRIKSHNEKWELSQWLNNSAPDVLNELSTSDLQLNDIRMNLANCDDKIEGFEVKEKEALEEEKRTSMEMKLDDLHETHGITCDGMKHMLLMCDIQTDTVCLLKDKELVTSKAFARFKDHSREFYKTVDIEEVDRLLAASTWILNHPTKMAAHYKTYFNQGALNEEVKLVKREREIEVKRWKHVLDVCHATENDKWHLEGCGITSVDDLVEIPLDVEKFKKKLQA